MPRLQRPPSAAAKPRRTAAADEKPRYTLGQGKSDAQWRDCVSALRIGGAATPRLVGHLFSIGGSHDLEGTHLKQTSQEMWQALHELEGALACESTHQVVRDVMQQLARLRGWSSRMLQTLDLLPQPDKPQGRPPRSLAREIAATIQAQPRVLLPASARGKEGAHALLIEVVTQGDGRYTLRIFNSSYNDPRQYRDPGTLKQVSHVDVNDIPTTIMESPAYIEVLLRLAYASHRPFDAVVKNLYDWATTYGTVAPPPTQDLHAGQSVRNCAWKCVSSYVRDRLPKMVYLRLKLEHRTRVLNDFAISARRPACVAYMAPLYGAGYAWPGPDGMAALRATYFAVPVGYTPVPVGWAWTYRPNAAALMRLSQSKLAKTYRRYVSSVLEQNLSPDGDLRRTRALAPGATQATR